MEDGMEIEWKIFAHFRWNRKKTGMESGMEWNGIYFDLQAGKFDQYIPFHFPLSSVENE